MQQQQSGYDILKAQLKTGDYAVAYHFYGEEQYLKQFYLAQLRERLTDPATETFNYVRFEGSTAPNDVRAVLDTPPMMAEKKMIVLRDTDAFTLSVRDKELWAQLFSALPEDVCVVALEEKFDKRSGAYKAFAKNGLSVEFAYRPRGDLKAWVVKVLGKSQKTIANDALEYFLDIGGSDMNGLLTHLEKLIAYLGSRTQIQREDVEKTVAREVFTKEYVLTDALLSHNRDGALAALRDLWDMRTDPIRVLMVIASNFLSATHARILLSNGASRAEAARALKLPLAFLANKTVEVAAKNTLPFLQGAVSLIRDTDYKIKLGLEQPRLAIETLAVRILALPQKDAE